MAGNSGSSKLQGGVKLPAIIIGAVLLIGLLVMMGVRAFGPDTNQAPTSAGVANDKWLDKIAKESGGDLSKVAPEDVSKMQVTYFGHADKALMQYAKDHGYAK